VYALGTLGYCLLCGDPPFSSGDPYLDIYRQIHDPPPPLSERRDPELQRPSAALEAVLLRCLEKDPDKRYASAAELAEALERTPEHSQWRPRPGAEEAGPTGAGLPGAALDEERAPTLVARRA
jgi:serine/threonine protein kinase